jgi:hypothetical protein
MVELAARDPRELVEISVNQANRAADRFRRRPSWTRRPFDEIATDLDRALGSEVTAYLEEDGLSEIAAEMRERIEQLGTDVPFPLVHNASPSLARLCYALCRALRPETVLETGVAWGVSSSFITKALAVNGHGELHSVDRPPTRPRVDDYVGALVPDELRSRWTLHRGTSRRVLPGLLPRLDGLSLFIHDSDHTYRNVTWELRTVTPRLVRPAVLLVDDTAGSRAFEHWVEREQPDVSAVVEHEMVGVAVLPGAASSHHGRNRLQQDR